MSDNDLRKAAVLIASLDSATADRLLDQMSPKQAAAVRNAVMDLQNISDDESSAVISEFMGRESKPSPEPKGVELDPSLATAIDSNRYSETSRPTYTPAKQSPPFRFLHEAAGEMLSDFLQGEHPQTIALVLAHLPPERAAEVLVSFDGPTQANVLRRVADLDETDRDVIHEVERILERHVSKHLQVVERRTAGMATVQAILNATERSDRAAVLQNLSQHQSTVAQSLEETDGSFDRRARSDSLSNIETPKRSHTESKTSPASANVGAGKPFSAPMENAGSTPQDRWNRSPSGDGNSHAAVSQQRPSRGSSNSERVPLQTPSEPSSSFEAPTFEDTIPFEFEQLADLDVGSLAKVLKQADSNLFFIALVGASPKLTNKIMKQLSGSEAKALRNRIEQQGPLRLRDIEIAQQNIAKIASRLVAKGDIPAPKQNRFAVTA